MSIKLGADPEILLIDDKGAFRSVEGLVGGTKDKPVPIPELGTQYAGYDMQEDNVMLEFNIPPQSSWDYWEHSIDVSLHNLEKVVSPHGLSFSKTCSAEYEQSQLTTAQASQFGCMPDMDAYTREKASGVSPTMLGNYRCAGGHVHLGYDNKAKIPPFVVAQLCDAYMGLCEVRRSVDQGMRRGMYGTAGRYREKPYGVEYRTLGNGWLFNKRLRTDIAVGAQRVAKLVDSGAVSRIHHVYGEIPFGEVRKAINSGDQHLASELMRFLENIAGVDL